MPLDSTNDFCPPVTTDVISEAVAKRDAAHAEIERAAQTIADGYKQASRADAYANDAAKGFREYDEAKQRWVRERDEFDPDKMISSFKSDCDRSVWRGLIRALNLESLMDKTALEELSASLDSDPPAVTRENIIASIESWRENSDLIFKRGVARVFGDLDPRFKSHDAFKLGSRMILDRAFSEWGNWSYHRKHEQSIIDVERVFSVLDGNAPRGRSLIEEINNSRPGHGARQSETETQYFKIRGFKNGNAHLWFRRDDLVTKVNKLLAEFYGEVIPDAAESGKTSTDYRQRSNLPAKDLQFYHTPEAVIDQLLRELHITDQHMVLEPSAGEGHITQRLAKTGACIYAVEIHPDRFERMRQTIPRGNAFNKNFLDMPTHEIYDYAIMNPPFYGTHYMDHVRKAFDLLKPGGLLRAVLPASARYNESKKHLEFRRWAEKHKSCSWGWQWRDLPSESFAECGTRIETTILELRK